MLSTLQNKLTLSSFEIEISMTQSRREMSNLIFESSVYTSNVVKTVRDETSLQNIKKQIQINFASMFQLTNVAVIISKKTSKLYRKNRTKNRKNQWSFWLKSFKQTTLKQKSFAAKKMRYFDVVDDRKLELSISKSSFVTINVYMFSKMQLFEKS